MLSPPQWITTTTALTQVIADLRRAKEFALDTESNSLYAYDYKVCLIQVSTRQADYLLDPIALSDLSDLGRLVADPSVESTIHAAENDILMMHREYGFVFNQIFDTLWAARILGWSKPGLASILKERFGITLDKRMQRADWGKRPLTSEQREYARYDTHFLLSLRDLQAAELQSLGRWQEAQEVFAELTNIRWAEREPPTFWRLPGARDLEPQEQAVLKALFDWREVKAHRRDVPPFKILRNEVLIALALTQPQNISALRAIKGIPKRLPHYVVQNLLDVIEQGQHDPPPEPQPRNHGGRRPDSDDLARFERLRSWRARKAQQRGVETDVVLTNQILMSIARAHPTDLEALAATELLGTWKLGAYGPEIVEVVRTR